MKLDRTSEDRRTDGLKVPMSTNQSGNSLTMAVSRAKAPLEFGDSNTELGNQHNTMISSEKKEGPPVSGISSCHMELEWCEECACQIENSLLCLHSVITLEWVNSANLASYNSFVRKHKELSIGQGTTYLKSAEDIIRKIDTVLLDEKPISGSERYQMSVNDVREIMLSLSQMVVSITENLCWTTKLYSVDRVCMQDALLAQIWQRFQSRLSGCLEAISKSKLFLKTVHYVGELKADREMWIALQEKLEEGISELLADKGSLGKKYSDIFQIQTNKDKLETGREELLIMIRDSGSEIDFTNQNLFVQDELSEGANYLEKTSQYKTPAIARLVDGEKLASPKVLADVSKSEELTPKITYEHQNKIEQTLGGLEDELKIGSEQTWDGLDDTSREEQIDDEIIEELKREVGQLKADNLKLQAEIDDIDIKLGRENMKLLKAKKSREQATQLEIGMLEKQHRDIVTEMIEQGSQLVSSRDLVCQKQQELGQLGDASREFLQKICKTQVEYLFTCRRVQEAEKRYLKAKAQLRSDNEFPKTFDSLRDTNSKLNREVTDLRAQIASRKQDAEKFKELWVEEQKRNQSWSVEMFRKVSSVEKKLERVEIEFQSWMGSQADEELCKLDQTFDEVWQDILRDLSGCTESGNLQDKNED